MALWPSACHAPSRSYQRAMDIDGQFNCVRLLQTTETLSCKPDRRMRPLQLWWILPLSLSTRVPLPLCSLAPSCPESVEAQRILDGRAAST
jgi:hypothetical protein